MLTAGAGGGRKGDGEEKRGIKKGRRKEGKWGKGEESFGEESFAKLRVLCVVVDLSPVHTVAENSETMAKFGDCRTFLRQCGQAFSKQNLK